MRPQGLSDFAAFFICRDILRFNLELKEESVQIKRFEVGGTVEICGIAKKQYSPTPDRPTSADIPIRSVSSLS